MLNIMPPEENITINKFHELLTIKLELLQGKDLSNLKSNLKTAIEDPVQFADAILNWCNEFGINLSEELTKARSDKRCDMIEPDQPIPERSPVTQNQIIQNIFTLLEKAEEPSLTETDSTNQTANQE